MAVMGDFLRALGHLADRRFRSILLRSILIALATLAALSAGAIWALGLLPETVHLPLIGEVGLPFATLEGLAVGAAVLLSLVLMVPVAALVVTFFLDEAAAAVEEACYPGLGPARATGFLEELRTGIAFMVTLIAVNALALLFYLLSGPLAPLAFWAVNGYLIGREYFELVALRRVSLDEMKRLRRRHLIQIWLAGVLVAVLLTLPLAGLVAPLLGVATLVHTFHRLRGTPVVSAPRAT